MSVAEKERISASVRHSPKCSGPGRRGWVGLIGARGRLRLRDRPWRQKRSLQAVTASVTALAPPDQGKSGRSVCRRPAREGDDDSLLKHGQADA